MEIQRSISRTLLYQSLSTERNSSERSDYLSSSFVYIDDPTKWWIAPYSRRKRADQIIKEDASWADRPAASATTRRRPGRTIFSKPPSRQMATCLVYSRPGRLELGRGESVRRWLSVACVSFESSTFFLSRTAREIVASVSDNSWRKKAMRSFVIERYLYLYSKH